MATLQKKQALARAFAAWEAANKAYLQARYRYDTAQNIANQATKALHEDFLRKKEEVRRATETYYAVLKAGRPITLSQREEKLLFSESEIANLKAKAKEIQALSKQ